MILEKGYIAAAAVPLAEGRNCIGREAGVGTAAVGIVEADALSAETTAVGLNEEK